MNRQKQLFKNFTSFVKTSKNPSVHLRYRPAILDLYLRVVPLDRPWKGHESPYVSDFLISVLNIWKDFKVLSRFIQKWIQHPACSVPFFLLVDALFWWKILLKNCTILVWIAVCWNSSLTSRNPKNICCLSCIFEARFSVKDSGLCTYKPRSEQAGGLEAFLYLAAQKSELFSNIKKSKIYSGWCSFQGLSNCTTLMQINLAKRYL